jgi:hypothetical protein
MQNMRRERLKIKDQINAMREKASVQGEGLSAESLDCAVSPNHPPDAVV